MLYTKTKNIIWFIGLSAGLSILLLANLYKFSPKVLANSAQATTHTTALQELKQVDFRKQFATQLKKSEQAGFQYQKSVLRIEEASKQTVPEMQQFNIQTQDTSWRKDLALATEYLFIEPQYIDFYEVESASAGSFIAHRKADADYPLKAQKIELSQTGNLKLIETEIIKENWLYTTAFSIKVQFLPNGLYQSHTFKATISLPFFSTQTEIQGLALYTHANP